MRKRCLLFKTKGEKGFTFIELLVVLTIIGVITAVGLVTYSRAQQKARNSRREADLKQIQAAIEMYHAEEGSYPGSIYPSIVGLTSGEVFLGNTPTDPLTGDPYSYNGCTGERCQLSAQKEPSGTIVVEWP